MPLIASATNRSSGHAGPPVFANAHESCPGRKDDGGNGQKGEYSPRVARIELGLKFFRDRAGSVCHRRHDQPLEIALGPMFFGGPLGVWGKG